MRYQFLRFPGGKSRAATTSYDAGWMRTNSPSASSPVKQSCGMYEKMKAEIQTSGRNTPVLFVNGEPAAPVLYGLSDIPGAKANTAQAQRNIQAFAGAGVRLVAADTGLHLGWHKHTPFDPEPLIEEIAAVLDANPDAGVLLRLHVNPPYFWLRDHPEECVVYRTAAGDVPGIDNGESDRLIRHDGDEHMRASLASQVWIREAGEKLTKFLKALEGTREGDALIGIQVAGGVYGEWHSWGVDVSAPMKRRFVEHLREKYPTPEALKAAWNDETVTYETAEFRPERYGCEGEGSLREPGLGQRIIDARETIQLAAPEAILAFCRVVKENAPHLLAGTFYAYYFSSMDQHTTIYGHLFPELIFRAKGLVDFLCGPMCYFENRNPDGIPMQRGLLESCRLNGILWLTEMDQHPFGTEKYVGGDPALLAETVAVLRRNTLQPLLAGHGFWFYDHRIIPSLVAPDSHNPSAASVYRKTGWWESATLMEAVGEIKRFADRIAGEVYKPRADVLLVYDTESFFYRAESADEVYRMQESLARAGVVYDIIYKKDFCRCRLTDYKAIIFTNCYLVTEQERALLCRSDALLIHMNGFGSLDGVCYSEENASKSAGMSLVKTGATSFSCGGSTDPIKAEYRPVYAVKDEAAEPLAYFEDGSVAAARKNNSVFIALPYIPLPLAEELLKEAGAHRYTDSGESVLAGYDYLAVCCQRAGEREVYLPSGRSVTVATAGYETVLLDINSGERIE